MKASDLIEAGFYWFRPGDDSPDLVRRHWTAKHGPTLVIVSIAPQLFGPTPLSVQYSYLLGPGHSMLDALRCGGEFFGPLRPPV